MAEMNVNACVLAGCLLGLLAGSALGEDPPVVVASIKPVHSLIAGVMEGVGDPHLLVKGGGSPHTYGLKPSDARLLENAAVVFWVGEELETFLARPIVTLAETAQVVALSQVEGLTLLSFREGGAWEGHADEEAEERHGADDGHDQRTHDTVDPHLWLDPANAVAMVEAIVAALASADPSHADHYRGNGAAVSARLRSLDDELSASLAPVKGKPYVVFHDSYQYFEHRYGLSPVGSITVSPDRAPGAARLSEMRRKLEETGARCVFAEPQFEPRVVNTVQEGSNARLGVLDPLGAELARGPSLYFKLMRNLGASLISCLLG
jgi:zinc transport system substrate-binding protein